MADVTNALDDKRRLVVQLVYDLFRERSKWPTFAVLDVRLDRLHDIDAQDVLRAMPSKYVRSNRMAMNLNDEDEVRLTLTGVATANGSREDIERVRKFVQWVARRERLHDAEGSGKRLVVTSEEAAAELGFDPAADEGQAAARRLWYLLDLLPSIRSGAQLSENESSWQITISREVRQFRDLGGPDDLVRRVEDYWQRLADRSSGGFPGTLVDPAAEVESRAARQDAVTEASVASRPSEPDAATTGPPEPGPDRTRRAVFLSVAEGRKGALAQPFRSLLRPFVDGYVLSDLPLVGDAYSPDEKVDAYLDRSQAVVVFATADRDAGQFIRPNIADEIARARSKPHLRNRICVLKQSGVTLPSNTNPAYNHLDPDHPEPAFAAALEQLKAWGFDLEVPEGSREQEPAAAPGAPAAPRARSSSVGIAGSEAGGLERALALVPQVRNAAGEASLVLVAAPTPRMALLRPSELEDPAFAAWLEREALYGDPSVLERGEATATGISGSSLIARQSRAWVAIDDEGTVVLMRPLARGVDSSVILRGIIEEEVLADLEADLAFVDRVLERVDPDQRATHVIPVVALVGATYAAWRSRAEQAASPNSMPINTRGVDRVVTHLSQPAQPRAALRGRQSSLAIDLMVLLRREARTK